MEAKEFFKLAIKTLDRQKTYFATRDVNVKNESMQLEHTELNEFVRVALINTEIHDYIMSECPYIANILRKEKNKEQSLF